MKKVNLLSKAEMKKVMGGVVDDGGVGDPGGGDPCYHWWVGTGVVCYNCCLYFWGDDHPEPYHYDRCASQCGY